jgi:hypothetical protein
MAHFAELDSNNVVLRVIVVDNKDTSDAHGVEKEHIGAAFCERVLGGTWKQTSYNGNMRGRYAGIGYTYNAQLDEFVAPVTEAGTPIDYSATPSVDLDALTSQSV